MYFKIAFNNVRKSFKDYSIYFLTLTFGVCIFYAFNSIGDQKAFTELGLSQAEYIKMLQNLISGISVFISCILGGLILYANNFIVKKRKKELGIYMTLGIGKNNISKILTYETTLVGSISLIVGLGVGIIFSQVISAFSAKLFEVPLSNYKFLFSSNAIVKTVLYFGIIFILVMLFNASIISKYKLIDMLTASKKNETMKIKNPIITTIIFLLSLGLLVGSYVLVIKVGLKPTDIMFLYSIVLGILGTLLLFFSLAGFVIYIIQKNNNIYLKGLNIFVVRQICSKINTNFLSMTVICLMLFLTISTLSTDLSLKNTLEKNLETTTPFDASISYEFEKNSKIKNIDEVLNSLGFKFNSDAETVSYNEYTLSNSNLEELLEENLKNKKLSSYVSDIPMISISSYNNIRALTGAKKLTLSDNQVLISSNTDELKSALKKIIKNNSKIKFNNKEFEVANNSLIGNEKIISEAHENDVLKTNTITLIVPDNIVANLEPYANKLDVNFSKNSNENQQNLNDIFGLYNRLDNTSDYGYLTINTRNGLYEETTGLIALIIFIGTYLGIIFLISSAAILALQQLSDASDSIERYKLLKKIGVSQKSINKSIFTQISIYFGLPLIISLIHSAVAIKVVNKFLIMFNKPDIVSSSLVTALMLVIVYGGYFYSTYTGYKTIVKNSLK
ncbi:FtsX-like permease family protein [Clostridium sardiniense]|uniref:FtsX-like permease family protein n=1 Tax=Clostridium sardiniense TaxID=29369 RepID=UPI001959EE21|nr:ABC transporter permease [Clostridium sardiniense]MBM7835565.1 putative ABC transport system permease protein [Clostridium sardiniense]